MLNIHWPFALIKVTPDSSSTILLRFDNILQLPLRDFFAMFNDLMTISKIYNIAMTMLISEMWRKKRETSSETVCRLLF